MCAPSHDELETPQGGLSIPLPAPALGSGTPPGLGTPSVMLPAAGSEHEEDKAAGTPGAQHVPIWLPTPSSRASGHPASLLGTDRKEVGPP